ncbi:MAG: phytanoyl-CoA dioxygenase family protein [Alphaproteobacteria bacterium]
MPSLLTQHQVDRYREDGFLSPVPILSEADADALRVKVEALEAELGGAITGINRSNLYLKYRWIYDLATTPAMLDMAEDLLGPDILLYYSNCWIKNDRDEGYVTWHQDITYFGHEPADVLTFWIALTPATEESGCMQVLPGTHRQGPLPLTTPDLNEKNMLPSGQLVDFDTDSIVPVSMPLQPGEASIHHACTIHGSLPNMSDHRRMGLTFCFHAPHLKQRGSRRTSAMLVRGQDRYGYYDAEIPPSAGVDPDASARHEHAVALYRAKEAELGKKTVTRLD